MKVFTNIIKHSLDINEGALAEAIQKTFSVVRAPVYIQFDKRLKTCYGLHRCKNIKYWYRLPKIITENIDAVKNNKDCFHSITISLDRYKAISQDSSEIKEWKLEKYYDDDYKIKDVYLMHLLAHELQHAKQVESGKQFDKIRDKSYVKHLDKHSLSTDDEFDAEVGAIIYGPILVRSYKKFCEHY